MYDFNGDFETIYTGETNIRMTGLIDMYNGDMNLPQWTGKCANVQGASDGVKFPSYIEPNDTLLFFRKSLCRSERMVILIICNHFDEMINSCKSRKNLAPSHAMLVYSVINFLYLYSVAHKLLLRNSRVYPSSNLASIFQRENFILFCSLIHNIQFLL